jgi:hypothetical protein
VTGHAAWATWGTAHGTRSVTVTRTLDPGAGAGEMVAIAPLRLRPTKATLDDALAVLGYTRVSAWADTTSGLVADVEPIRHG